MADVKNSESKLTFWSSNLSYSVIKWRAIHLIIRGDPYLFYLK